MFGPILLQNALRGAPTARRRSFLCRRHRSCQPGSPSKPLSTLWRRPLPKERRFFLIVYWMEKKGTSPLHPTGVPVLLLRPPFLPLVSTPSSPFSGMDRLDSSPAGAAGFPTRRRLEASGDDLGALTTTSAPSTSVVAVLSSRRIAASGSWRGKCSHYQLHHRRLHYSLTSRLCR